MYMTYLHQDRESWTQLASNGDYAEKFGKFEYLTGTSKQPNLNNYNIYGSHLHDAEQENVESNHRRAADACNCIWAINEEEKDNHFSVKRSPAYRLNRIGLGPQETEMGK